MLESQATAKVFIPKELLTKAQDLIQQGGVYQLSGWYNEKQGTLRIGKRSTILRETQGSANKTA